MSAGDDIQHGEPQRIHRDFPPLAMLTMQDLVPATWHRLSKEECLLLAMALHRAAQGGREAAFANIAGDGLQSASGDCRV